MASLHSCAHSLTRMHQQMTATLTIHALHTVHFTALYTAHCLYCTLRTALLCTLHTVHCVYCTLRTALLCALHTAHCALHTAHCTALSLRTAPHCAPHCALTLHLHLHTVVLVPGSPRSGTAEPSESNMTNTHLIHNERLHITFPGKKNKGGGEVGVG
jgi:hypothetical protein